MLKRGIERQSANQRACEIHNEVFHRIEQRGAANQRGAILQQEFCMFMFKRPSAINS